MHLRAGLGEWLICETYTSRLARFHGVMTREEEYYYANDYGPRFRNQIMQPRSLSTDAAWPRLHPVVEKCVVDIGQ